MQELQVNTQLLFILVRDARLDGYHHVNDYLKETYNVELANGYLAFNDINKKLLFELTYSGYV